MTMPNEAEVWTKATRDQTGVDPSLRDKWFCTDEDHHNDDSSTRPAMLIARDGHYAGDGVCLRHAAKYLGRKP
jgi:hypothetical protein